MTKYEWERELKKHIAILPQNEQNKIFDYYNEMFEDRIEAGMQEKDIIYEFGNPYDVAQKILIDYRFEETEPIRPPRYSNISDSNERNTENENGTSSPQKTNSSKGGFGRAILMLVFYVFIGIPVLAVILSLAAAGIMLAAGCFALIAGGIVYAVYWLVQLFALGFAASSVVPLGLGLLCTGLGFAFIVPCFKITKAILLCIIKILKATFRYIRGKKEVNA